MHSCALPERNSVFRFKPELFHTYPGSTRLYIVPQECTEICVKKSFDPDISTELSRSSNPISQRAEMVDKKKEQLFVIQSYIQVCNERTVSIALVSLSICRICYVFCSRHQKQSMALVKKAQEKVFPLALPLKSFFFLFLSSPWH